MRTTTNRIFRFLTVRVCVAGILSVTLGGHSWAMEEVAMLGSLPAPGLYERLVEPSEYPAYAQRAFPVPTWKTFGNRPQMVGGRYRLFTQPIPNSYLMDLPSAGADMSGRDWLLGKVYQPNIGILKTPEPAFSDSLRRMRDTGMFLFNVGGYGPGSGLNGSYGQVKVTDAQSKALTEILGEQWLGFDLGEQDGRYHNGFESRQLPAPRDRVEAHRLFRDWCDRVIADQGGKISMLTVLWGWHYPTQDGAMTLIGAESECKCGITSPQVQYAFLRGAGKQYGVLWFGNVALFNTFGVKGWRLNGDGSMSTDGSGSSLNLMRRLFVSQWLWNSCILSFENSTLARSKNREQARVSPLGRVQLDTERLIQRGFSPGVMQTPVAILQDYFSGWMPPRSNAAQFQCFNSMSYTSGDYLTDSILSLLLPGYEDSGWYFDERGALCPTPYGEIADCLLGDAPAEILSRYSLVLVSGIDHDTSGVKDRLESFLSGGGVVLATGNDAARLWPEYCKEETKSIPCGSEIVWTEGHASDKESLAFEIHTASVPRDGEVLATCDGQPAVIRVPRGKGTLIITLASTGMNSTRVPCQASRSPYSQKGENTPIERPYHLLVHVKRAYDEALKSQRIFTCGDGLSVTTCHRADGKFVVGVSNPSLESQPFEIVSHIGSIESIKEISLGDPVETLPGYWPGTYGPYKPTGKPSRQVTGELKGNATLSDEKNIRGGDIRLFEVALKSCTAQERPDRKPPAAPRDRVVMMPDLTFLKDRLVSWPRFSYYFDGVAITSEALMETDPEWLHDSAGWFRRHGIRLIVDVRKPDEASLRGVVERLSKYGRGAELIVKTLPEPLQASATQAGLVVLQPDKVRRLEAGSVPRREGGRLDVLMGDWRSWDALYRDVRAAWLAPEAGVIAGPGPVPPSTAGKAKAGLNRFVALHGVAGSAQALEGRPGLLEHFDGIVLDAKWLEGRSREAIESDRKWLQERGLAVVVDFSRLINRFPDLTFGTVVPHMYEESVRRFDSALDKMVLLGSKDAIIISHEFDPGARWNPGSGTQSLGDQNTGIERFLDKAASVGITAHWLPSKTRPPGQMTAHAAVVAGLQRRHSNLKIAASTVDEPDPAKLLRSIAPAGKPELWLVAAPETSGERTGQRHLPASLLPSNQLKAILEASKDAKLVFFADYLSWDEVLADCERMP